VFGVENFQAMGFEGDSDAITNKLSHLANDSQEPSLGIESFSLDYNHRQLLCVHVSSAKTKPVFIKDRSPLGGDACFKRTGACTVLVHHSFCKKPSMLN